MLRKKWVLSDTALRAFLPRNLVAMTDSHMQLCGCEPCIVCKKNLLITVNAWCTRLHTSLLNEAGKVAKQKTRGSEEKKREILDKAEAVKEFSKAADGTAKYKHPRDIVAAMTCPKVDTGGNVEVHRVECCLGRCRDCAVPELELEYPDIMKDKGPNARMTKC